MFSSQKLDESEFWNTQHASAAASSGSICSFKIKLRLVNALREFISCEGFWRLCMTSEAVVFLGYVRHQQNAVLRKLYLFSPSGER